MSAKKLFRKYSSHLPLRACPVPAPEDSLEVDVGGLDHGGLRPSLAERVPLSRQQPLAQAQRLGLLAESLLPLPHLLLARATTRCDKMNIKTSSTRHVTNGDGIEFLPWCCLERASQNPTPTTEQYHKAYLRAPLARYTLVLAKMVREGGESSRCSYVSSLRVTPRRAPHAPGQDLKTPRSTAGEQQKFCRHMGTTAPLHAYATAI